MDLRELGFNDPVKMIASSPPILGLAIDNIRSRIADLLKLGFNDPVKMVTSSPAILGYALAVSTTSRRVDTANREPVMALPFSSPRR